MNKIKTVYAAAITICGADAAKLHGVTVSSIEKWSRGLSKPPEGIWKELREYYAMMISVSYGGEGDLNQRSSMIVEALKVLR